MRTWTTLRARLVYLLALASFSACGDSPTNPNPAPTPVGRLPEALPFSVTRPLVGTPPSADEVTAFTKKLTGFWKRVDYFRWCTWHSHGLHRSYDPSMPDYSLWWQDTVASKQGDTVTFRHVGGADNIMIRTPKVLTQAIAGYMTSGDPVMRELLIGYAKGIVALFQGMAWGGENPPVESITARAIFTHNHAYTTSDGRKVAVDYDPVKSEKFDWNAHTVPNPDNPFFGSIWVRNMRSKDDVPHMYRVAPLLMRVAQDAQDEEVRAAAQKAVDYLEAFARDIVAHGYTIRTKEDGIAYTPKEDLASFVTWEKLVPNAECNAKLATALLASHGTLGNDCGAGLSPAYETIATDVHYFNHAIIRYFHLAAITNALVRRQDATAKALFAGLIERVDAAVSNDEGRAENPEWDADLAAYLVAAGASGLPLTAREAVLIQQQYAASVSFYEPWPYWDLWDGTVPDGEYQYQPSRDGDDDARFVRAEEMTFLMEYCYSPWRNPEGIDPVDCDVVLDPARWGI